MKGMSRHVAFANTPFLDIRSPSLAPLRASLCTFVDTHHSSRVQVPTPIIAAVRDWNFECKFHVNCVVVGVHSQALREISMKALVAAAALAVGLMGVTATSADAYPHHPWGWHSGYYHGGYGHHGCHYWGWHHGHRWCRGWW
jgi:hypothetical protein